MNEVNASQRSREYQSSVASGILYYLYPIKGSDKNPLICLILS